MEDLKDWLAQYRDQARYIDLLVERAATLEEQIKSPRVPQLDDMPHGSGRACDPIGTALARLDGLRDQIDKEREREILLYEERDSTIDQITGKRWAEWRAVLKMRYLDFMPWESICFAMFGSEDDYDEKADSYQRRTFGLHKEALKELAKTDPLQSGKK